MKKFSFAINILLLTACSDPSPLKSDIEVKINHLFGTDFGVVDQVYINSGNKNLTVISPKELLSYITDTKKVPGAEENEAISIILKTSDSMKQYSNEQTSENLSYNLDQQVLYNEKSCYKVSKELNELIQSLTAR